MLSAHAESIILSAPCSCADSIMLSVCTESIILSVLPNDSIMLSVGGAESIIMLSAGGAESIILSALSACAC